MHLKNREKMLSGRLRENPLLHTLCDETLFRRFVEGDDASYLALYQRYSARLLGYLQSIVGVGDPAADDLFQETFLRLWRERTRCLTHQSAKVTNVGGWLFRVARNLSLNHLRSCRYLTSFPPASQTFMAMSVEEAHAELYGEAREEEALLHAIDRVVKTLPATLREIFELREVNGLSYKETAEIAGCTEEAARMRLSRARSAIRTALQHFVKSRE